MAADSMPVWEQRFRAPTVSLPSWAPHAPDRLVYLSDESGSFQVHTWDHSNGERSRVTDEPVGVADARPSGDGGSVVWFQDETGDESGRWMTEPFGGGRRQPLLDGVAKGWPQGLAIGRRVIAAGLSDRRGFAIHVSADGGPPREVHRNEELVQIGGAESGSEQAGLSADDALLCLEHAEHGDSLHPALRVIDPRSGEVVAEENDGDRLGLQAIAWSPIPGDQRLAIVHEREGFARPAIWDLATGERRDLRIDVPGEVTPFDWWPDGSGLLLSQLHEGRDRLLRLDLSSGQVEPLPHPEGSISAARVRPDGRLWLRTSSGERESRVLSDTGEEVIVPDGRPRAPAGRPFQSWTFTNPKGQRVHGFYATPPGGGPFPVFMEVHGGPTWLYQDTWLPHVQALVDHGFAVGMVNYRGSTGYGAEWRDTLIGNIGFPEVEDVVAGMQDLAERGIADPSRAVVGGYSWGGYITLLALGLHPDRWSAGVAGVPVGDYVASYDDSAPSLQAYDRSLLGGTPGEVPNLMRERSPIVYVDRVRAPVLVLAAENDSRCPIRQIESYVNALTSAGGRVEVYRYQTGHSSFVVDEEVRQTRTTLEFLEKHVGLSARAF